jgi:beta-mannosidase
MTHPYLYSRLLAGFFMRILLNFLFLALPFSLAAMDFRQQLSGSSWQFRQAGKNEWHPAAIPGCVYSDLLKAGLIPDPYYRDNEKAVQWVEKVAWWEYRHFFSAGKRFLSDKNPELVFEGLDTYADVYLNGNRILSASNMFLQHRIPVKGLLKADSNELRVYLRSALTAAMPAVLNNPLRLPAVSDADTLPTSPYSRKAPFHFGWDWGPRLVGVGIWKEVYLETRPETGIEDFHLITKSLYSKSAAMMLKVQLRNPGAYELKLAVKVGSFRKLFPLKKGEAKQEIQFELPDPKLWWCNGKGKPHLYQTELSLLMADQVLDVKKTKTGIRTIELVQERDKYGKSFYFRLNGKPVFMKGANYIPPDHFPDRAERKKKQLLEDCADAHFNMLRVWGGGVYESDDFYRLCDSLGLLVWQDFMFSCALYPSTPEFLQSVQEEVRQQSRRLRNHPSLALWCGNNENETAWHRKWLKGNIRYSAADSARVWEDYKNLFHKLIPAWMREEDAQTSYTRSSPSANDDAIIPEKKGFGDTHDWGVWFTTGDYTRYSDTPGRFISEYGYQSHPSLDSWEAFSLPEDRNEQSAVMAQHQKHPNGNRKIRQFGEQFYPTASDFADLVYKSQLQQADAYAYAIMVHRARQKNPWFGSCMGTLFWQLNDCWPALSWSVTDWYGRKKAAWYRVKEAFADDLQLQTSESDKANDNLAVYLRNYGDSITISGIRITVKDFTGQVFRQTTPEKKKSPATLEYNNIPAGKSRAFSFSSGLRQVRDSMSTWALVEALDKNGKTLVSKAHYFVLPKHLNLKPADIRKKLKPADGGYELTLETDNLAKNVMIGCRKGLIDCSDNFFDIFPKSSKTIFIKTSQKLTASDLYWKALNPAPER